MPRGDNNRRLSDNDRSEIVRRYTTRLPDGTWEGASSIGRSLGVASETVRYHLRRAGIAIRNGKDAHAGKVAWIKHTEQLGEPPPCACGCGERVTWARSKYRWCKYVAGHQRPDAPFKDGKWLRQQYVELRRSANEIAAEFSVNTTTIIRHLERHGIARRDASASKIGRFGGAKNPAWRGGTTPERQRLHKQGGGRAFVLEIYKRDHFRCQRCSGTAKGPRSLAAHHVKAWANHPELRFEPSNVVTLCRKCHLWVHSTENTRREYMT